MGDNRPLFSIYTDGSYNRERDQGGWAAIIKDQEKRYYLSGREGSTTSQRMELLAAIKALEAIPEGAEAVVYSDSEYLIHSMNGRYKRHTNHDLWRRLDALASSRQVRWEWVRGHAGQPDNEEVHALAEWQAGLRQEPPRSTTEQGEPPHLTHVDQQGRARMVDVGWKPATEREAVAKGSIRMNPHTLELVKRGGLEKGDVLAAARIAGILGAKHTPTLIPLCHPLPLSAVHLDFSLDQEQSAVHITARAKATAQTGVEMEALTAVALAALTIYDMCKGVDKTMRIENLRLVKKTGGKSGDWILEEGL